MQRIAPSSSGCWANFPRRRSRYPRNESFAMCAMPRTLRLSSSLQHFLRHGARPLVPQGRDASRPSQRDEVFRIRLHGPSLGQPRFTTPWAEDSYAKRENEEISTREARRRFRFHSQVPINCFEIGDTHGLAVWEIALANEKAWRPEHEVRGLRRAHLADDGRVHPARIGR